MVYITVEKIEFKTREGDYFTKNKLLHLLIIIIFRKQ